MKTEHPHTYFEMGLFIMQYVTEWGLVKWCSFFLSMETRGILFKHPSFVVGVFKWKKRYIHGIYCVKFVFNWKSSLVNSSSFKTETATSTTTKKKRNTSSLGCIGVLDFNEIEPFQFFYYTSNHRELLFQWNFIKREILTQ